MQKTKMGISVGVLGAAIYFIGLFSGYLAVVILTGYVLLFEKNEWLRKSAVKAIALMIVFSLLVSLINLIPNTLDVINGIFILFGCDFGIGMINGIVSVIIDVINIVEKIVFIGLGMKALNQGTIEIPVVDNLINKYS